MTCRSVSTQPADGLASRRGLVADGITVLLSTQYLEEADQLADRIAVIDRGRVVASGTAEELRAMVGGERVELCLPAGSDLDAAARAVEPLGNGPLRADRDACR